MERLKAFYYGVVEFRDSLTMHFADDDLRACYDRGREWAHRLTFRYFEPS